MKHRAGRIHHKRAIRNDTGVMPALSLCVVHNKHMIGEDLAKAELGLILRLLLRALRQRHRNIVHDHFLHQSSDYRRTSGQIASNRSNTIVSPTLHAVKCSCCRSAHNPEFSARLKQVFFTICAQIATSAPLSNIDMPKCRK